MLRYVDKVGRFETFPLPTLVAKTETHIDGEKKKETNASGCVAPSLLIGTSETNLGKLGFALSL
jgi:hypothetical protein